VASPCGSIAAAGTLDRGRRFEWFTSSASPWPDLLKSDDPEPTDYKRFEIYTFVQPSTISAWTFLIC